LRGIVVAATAKLNDGKNGLFPVVGEGPWYSPLFGGIGTGGSSYQELQKFFTKTIAIDF
jgi:hypothetical protein